ncbi:hypothetical protein PIB30_050170 [Stylosanthes scabra]|uniref:Uncharacterized protein n=1 Tax=Stylosanthes scabra TaxID=79078 RepID=A0ABU6QGX2_9FABA|nr:hypothetical protein [Stylosanthes scabra]
MRTHLVQQWPSRFCCDPFVPFALSGHFLSELRLLYSETLKAHTSRHRAERETVQNIIGAQGPIHLNKAISNKAHRDRNQIISGK